MKDTLQINKEHSERYVQHKGYYEIPQLLREFIEKSKVICDLGCGDGAFIFSVAQEFPKIKIIGVDISPRRINGLKEKFKQQNYLFLCEDVCETSIGSDSVDLVFCSQVIEHIQNDKRLVEEINRIIRPGGYLWISSVIKKAWAIYKYRNRYGNFVLDPTHEREYKDEKEFKNLLKNKFEIITLEVLPVRRKYLIPIRIPGYSVVRSLARKIQ